MTTFTIAFVYSNLDERIEAEYYKHEDGWITFKDAEHKVVAAAPESGVRMITARRPAPPASTVNHFTINNAPAPEDAAKSAGLRRKTAGYNA